MKAAFKPLRIGSGVLAFLALLGALTGALGAGLDLKWGFSSSMTLDATVTPDFGQVDAFWHTVEEQMQRLPEKAGRTYDDDGGDQ